MCGGWGGVLASLAFVRENVVVTVSERYHLNCACTGLSYLYESSKCCTSAYEVASYRLERTLLGQTSLPVIALVALVDPDPHLQFVIGRRARRGQGTISVLPS